MPCASVICESEYTDIEEELVVLRSPDQLRNAVLSSRLRQGSYKLPRVCAFDLRPPLVHRVGAGAFAPKEYREVAEGHVPIDLKKRDFSRLKLVGVFAGCDLRGASFDGSELRGVEFSDLSAFEGRPLNLGIVAPQWPSMYSTKMDGVTLRNCKLDGCRFRLAKCPIVAAGSVFQNCRFESDFAGADFRDAVFIDCVVSGSLRGAVLEGAQFIGMPIDEESMEGAVRAPEDPPLKTRDAMELVLLLVSVEALFALAALVLSVLGVGRRAALALCFALTVPYLCWLLVRFIVWRRSRLGPPRPPVPVLGLLSIEAIVALAQMIFDPGATRGTDWYLTCIWGATVATALLLLTVDANRERTLAGGARSALLTVWRFSWFPVALTAYAWRAPYWCWGVLAAGYLPMLLRWAKSLSGEATRILEAARAGG